MPTLTQAEAVTRAGLIAVDSYTVDLDLTQGEETFSSTTVVRFRCTRPGADTFVEINPDRLRRAVLNGVPLPVATLVDTRMPLPGLAADNELVVAADMRYSRTGEGLHRAVDPADGETYLYATACPTDAPRVFACFDQPDLKAPFTVTVTAPPEWTVLGNGPATRVAPGRWELATTPPLATYLTTLVAGPYHGIQAEHDGIPLGLYCRRSLAADLDRDADELLTITRQCFDRYHELFGVRYPFGKYDQVFVPEFNQGAMENPGCVTFRDELVYRSAVTDSERQLRAVIIAHEMAHMWFGDLVTLRWWDDIWLNESFAENMGHRVAAEATRFTGAWTNFAVARKAWGYAADQRPSTHPVSADVADVDQALLNFDGISYAKGASVLRQLLAWVGDDAFLAGLREYFQRHAHGNAALPDLLAALEQASGRDLSDWSRLWLRTSQVNTLRPQVRLRGGGEAAQYDEVAIVQTAPESHPVLRPHRVGVGAYRRVGATGRVVLAERVEVDLDPAADGGRTVVPELAGLARPEVLLVNDGDLTYAKARLDEYSLAALPEVLGDVEDSLARALLWQAAHDMTRDAELAPRAFVDLVARHVGNEPVVPTLEDLLQQARVGVDRWLSGPAREDALAVLAAACRQLLDGTPPGDDRQLAAARGFLSFAGSGDVATLQGWLAGQDVPAGLQVDAELRWTIRHRLAVLGAATEADIRSEGDGDPSAMGVQWTARCLAALPDGAAKERAWQLMTGEAEVSNQQLRATGQGFWHPEQAAVTEPYVARFFTEMPAVAARRSQMMVQLLGLLCYPRYAVAEATLARVDEMLARDDLTAGLRRTVVDSADETRRALRVRTAFS